MVDFKFLSLDDPRLTTNIKANFLNVDQLVGWELIDTSGTYTGLVVLGQKPVPQGFHATADFTVDNPAIAIPTAKTQEISHTVQTEFVQRAVFNSKS
jgi:hypothetical protein